MPNAIVHRRIEKKDPLYQHFSKVVLPRAGIEVKAPAFESSRLNASETVYFFKEKNTRFCFVGKFFGLRPNITDHARRSCLRLEFKNLVMARKIGLCDIPYRVVRPLSKTERLNFMLVEDYARGHDLDYYITKAAYNGQHERLCRKLTLLAHFFFQLHGRTASAKPVSIEADAQTFQSIVEALAGNRLIEEKTASEFSRLCDQWVHTDELRSVHAVWIHGDATPTNFIFHSKDGVTAIDLERMRLADAAVDIGMVAAELKHHFAWRILQADAAEPFIRHFLKIYSAHFPDPETVFKQISLKNRFFMAMGEIRIARNVWLPRPHRVWLVEEARLCLRQ